MSPTDTLALFHFESCPFCARVRGAMARIGIDLPLRDVLRDPGSLDELVAATGKRTVPCLRIEDTPGEVQWLHESTDIIDYLDRRFSPNP
jgi:glutathione S-transferase